MRGRTTKTGAGRRGWELGDEGVGAGRQGVGIGRRGVGAGRRRGWRQWEWEKNSLGRKFTLYGWGWENGGGGWETLGWEIGESTPCQPLLYVYR